MNRIRELRENLELKQLDLAKKLNVSQGTLSNWEREIHDLDNEALLKLAEYFNVSTDYLLGVSDDPIPSITLEELKKRGMEVFSLNTDLLQIPIYGTIKAGYDGLAYQDFEGFEALDRSVIKGETKDYFFLRVKGDSMNPEILDKDLVLIKKQNSIDYSGQIAVIIYGDEEATLKKVYMNDKYIELRPSNSSYQPRIIIGNELESVRICGIMKKLVRNY